jgi:type I restriction enzyme S subunit
MSEWKTKKLQELCDVRDGTHESPKYHDFGIPFITSKNLKSNYIDFNDISFISIENHKLFSQRSKVEKGDILFAMIGTVGNPVLVDIDKEFSIKNVALLKFGQSKELLNTFALQILKSNIILEQFRNKSDGGVQSFVSLSTIRNLNFPVPSITQQQRISHILTTCDSVIERTQSAISKYKAIKQGMLHDLFTRGLDSNGKLRPTFEAAPELYKSSELGMIPKDWAVRRLDEITEKIGSGVTPTGGSEVYQTFGVLFIRSQNVLIGNLSIEDAAFISSDIDEIMEGSRVRPYDVLLNITGASIGRCAYFPKELKSANVNQHVCIIRFKRTSKPLAIYASEFLNSNFGQSQIYKSIAGGNREGLNFQQIKSFSFPSISQLELEKISKIINILGAKMNAEETLLQKYQSVKRGLMGDLLGGGILL